MDKVEMESEHRNKRDRIKERQEQNGKTSREGTTAEGLLTRFADKLTCSIKKGSIL